MLSACWFVRRACYASICVVLLVGLSCVGEASGRVIISEIWPGGLPGEEASSDWFELTNLGTEAVAGLGSWHVRDVPVPEGVPDGLWLQGGS
jgi:hypothetical protein